MNTRSRLLKILLAVIGISFILPTFTLYPFEEMSVIDMARVFGLMSLQLLWWQVILGNRFVARLVSQDLTSVNKIHKIMGQYGFGLLALHLLLIFQWYGLEFILPSFESLTSKAVFVGTVAFDLALLLWITSAFTRNYIPWRWWKRLHLVAYIVITLAFVHSWFIGSHIVAGGFWRGWWFILGVSLAVVTVSRFWWASGGLKLPYEVVELVTVANNVKRVELRPKQKSITPHPGQFAYIQLLRFGESHPFTVSHFNPINKHLSFSVKSVGPFSKEMHQLQIGQNVFIDGPYGAFTLEVRFSERPAVFVAGGIGITPFLRRIWQNEPEHLFYANRRKQDIAYLKDIAGSFINVTHILSDEKNPAYEHGYITVNTLKRDLDEPLKAYDFFVCGPPPMMQGLVSQLREAGVSEQQIFTDRFSL